MSEQPNNVEQTLQEQQSALKSAQEQLVNEDYKLKYEETVRQLESMQNALSAKDQLIRDYQDLNQKLFLRTGGAIGAINQTVQDSTSDMDPVLKSALDKIAAYNATVQ